MRTLSKIILLGFVVFHLTLVSLSASYLGIADWIPGKTMIDFYKKASGAGGTYGFFAPDVGAKMRVLFDVVNANGQKISNISLLNDTWHEAQLRASGIADEFIDDYVKSQGLRKSLAASLAAAIFTKYSDSSDVIVRVEEYWPITMQEYRQGDRAIWSEQYLARFAKRSNQKDVP